MSQTSKIRQKNVNLGDKRSQTSVKKEQSCKFKRQNVTNQCKKDRKMET